MELYVFLKRLNALPYNSAGNKNCTAVNTIELSWGLSDLNIDQAQNII